MKSVMIGITLCFTLGVGAALAQGKDIHRVVTSLDDNNKSIALFDSEVPLKIGGAGEGVASLWVTEKGPADFSWKADRSGARKSVVIRLSLISRHWDLA